MVAREECAWTDWTNLFPFIDRHSISTTTTASGAKSTVKERISPFWCKLELGYNFWRKPCKTKLTCKLMRNSQTPNDPQPESFFYYCFGPPQKQWKVEQMEQHASNAIQLKHRFSGRQRTHNALVMASVAKEHFGAFWSVLGHRFVHCGCFSIRILSVSFFLKVQSIAVDSAH
jgi:hypothetical protein